MDMAEFVFFTTDLFMNLWIADAVAKEVVCKQIHSEAS